MPTPPSPKSDTLLSAIQRLDAVTNDGPPTGNPTAAVGALSSAAVDGTGYTAADENLIANAFGPGYEPAFSAAFQNTQDAVNQALNTNSRSNNAPQDIGNWQCQIGAATFYVPPTSIQVTQNFNIGSLTGAAIRQMVSPKFNSGHSETMITMTLFFPSSDQIWGFNGDSTSFDFLNAPDAQVDQYCSSLRGFITQFKYTPIVSIKNQFLNESFNITSVALQGLTISTVPNYPFCISAQVQMLSFNHKVFLPMVNQLSDAMNWGRFRAYLGRAAVMMEAAASQSFIRNNSSITSANDIYRKEGDPAGTNTLFQDTKSIDSQTIEATYIDNSDIEFFFPDHDPASQIVANMNNFDANNAISPIGGASWWDNLLSLVGLNVGSLGSYTQLQGYLTDPSLINQVNVVKNYLTATGKTIADMGNDSYDAFHAQEFQRRGLTNTSAPDALQTANREIAGAWYTYLYQHSVTNNSSLQKLFALQQYLTGTVEIDEWDIPMVRLNLNPAEYTVAHVQVTMGNNFSKLQLNMLDAPAYQHLGGLDTVTQVTLLIQNEENLTAIRTMYDTINGLARLEHSHAVLGFLGIKNMMSAICGCRYVIPRNFTVNTVPDMPHLYEVSLEFVDFDVFQQKREMLSSDQEAEFIQLMSKRNPFLRLQQAWSSFSGYPDFPLAIKDDKGAIVGHYDPDYYFNAYHSIDTDLVQSFTDGPKYAGTVGTSQGTAQSTGAEGGGPATYVHNNGTAQSTGAEGGGPQAGVTSQNSDYPIIYHLGPLSDKGNHQSIGISYHGLDLRSGNNVQVQNFTVNEPHAGNMFSAPFVNDGKTAATPPPYTVNPNFTAEGLPSNRGTSVDNFKNMLEDTQYRDKSGRMVRAFPTYMLFLINEGGQFAGVKLFDDFYGLQSVIDFHMVASEDTMGDTLQLRVSNLYSRLSTDYSQLINPSIFPNAASLINGLIKTTTSLATGTNPNFMVDIQSFNLQPGVRIHLRVGYSGNPSLLETIFNGVVTEVQQGDIITITAQSDAIELGAIVDDNHQGGSTGSIDGSLTAGFYLSEPRDLMVRLLSMGASTFKQAMSYATKGMIFSENKFGIRHFGNILYDTMTPREAALQHVKTQKMQGIASDVNNFLIAGPGNAPGNILSPQIGALAHQLWVNVNSQRDYEIFKRNIYPGNGSGISQYMGGDIGDGGIATGFNPPGVNADGIQVTTSTIDPRTVLQTAQNITNGQIIGNYPGAAPQHTLGIGLTSANSQYGGLHPFAKYLGIDPEVSDDVPGNHSAGQINLGPIHIGTPFTHSMVGPYAEVSFRAETYMKSVWDLFQLCAALLPNYIVAVRPWMGRSTVFYGKPHWAYTSGIIPLTTGIDDKAGPALTGPDSSMQQIINQVQQLVTANDQISHQDLYQQLNYGGQTSTTGLTTSAVSSNAPSAVGGDPTTSTQGATWGGGDISGLPLTAPSGAVIPYRTGKIGLEMHLPTSNDLQTDMTQHKQLDSLPAGLRHPFYMDRTGGGVGGYASIHQYDPTLGNNQTVLGGDSPTNPGKSGAFGILSPADEQYYFNMDFPTGNGYPDIYRNRRVLIFNPATNLGCICTPGDWGPASGTGRVAGASPDTFMALGGVTQTQDVVCWFGFVNDDTPLGPVVFQKTATFQNSPLPATGAPVGNTTAGDGLAPSATQANPTQGVSQPAPVANDPNAPSDPKAQAVYKDYRTQTQAGQIMTAFRDMFGSTPVNSAVKAVFDKYYPTQDARLAQVTKDFVDFMTKPGQVYQQGWLVLTADVSDNTVSAQLDTIAGALFPPLGLAQGATGIVDGILNSTGLAKNVVGSTIESIANYATHPFNDIHNLIGDIGGLFGGGQKSNFDANWSFGRALNLFGVYLQQGPGSDTTGSTPTGAIEWMLTNNQPGYSSGDILGRSMEELSGSVTKTIKSAYDDVAGVVSTLASGISSLYNYTMMLINQGISMSGFSGKQANLLNSVYNDSSYYDPSLGVGSILWQADNCFTREMGEPVIEIREPFQRLHYINSFQHILSNGMSESMTDVATVVTATSNGKHPHTVYFDKGAPTDKQYEKAIDTGLYFDAPNWYSAVFHPVQMIRSYIKDSNGSDDATEAVRVARAELKKGLQDIYTGEIFILGDAQIRPFDLVFMADSYSKIQGLFEVEQVVHHFTPENGFVTAITPNAIVTVNDPERWSLHALLHGTLSKQTIRNTVRHSIGAIQAKSQAAGFSNSIQLNDIINTIGPEIQGSTQYCGGASSMVKDVVGAAVLQNPVAGGIAGFLGWEAYKWVRGNILDAHSCQIQYLNRNGVPMDAGLSYNHGVAVGQLPVYTGLGQALGIDIPIPGRNQVITTSQLLQQIGWNQQAVEEVAAKDISKWVNQSKTQLLTLTGRAPEAPPLLSVLADPITVTGVIDSVTLEIQSSGLYAGITQLRLMYLQVPAPLGASAAVTDIGTSSNQQSSGTPGYQAYHYITQLLAAGTLKNAYVRLNPTSPTVPGRPDILLGTVFFRAVSETQTGQIDSVTHQNALSYPAITWDSFMSDGTPYTLNEELISLGYAAVDVSVLNYSLPGQGVVTPNLGLFNGKGVHS